MIPHEEHSGPTTKEWKNANLHRWSTYNLQNLAIPGALHESALVAGKGESLIDEMLINVRTFP
jgi:hypothetical protein